MDLLGGIIIGSIVLVAGWRRYNPPCPTCGARKWDRKLCHPLLLCRRCAQRIDRAGRKYN